MMDVRTLGIKKDWYEIAQERQKWMTVCEQICASVGAGEVCAAKSSLIQTFLCTCGHSFKHSGGLTRHQRFCGTQHVDYGSLEPLYFIVPVEGPFIGKEILPGI